MPGNQKDIEAVLAQAEQLASETERQLGTAAQSRPTDTASGVAATPSTTPQVDPARLRHILRIEVPVIVNLAERRMRLGEVIRLSAGAIVEFDKPADADLSLLVNNKCIAYGTAVKVGENFGLRIKSIGTPEERLGALSPSITER